MSLIVQKFGGSSVADADKNRNVCNIIADTKAQGHRVVAVLSAGERISVWLAAMCTESMGYPAVSLTGWQAGIRTTSQHNGVQTK